MGHDRFGRVHGPVVSGLGSEGAFLGQFCVKNSKWGCMHVKVPHVIMAALPGLVQCVTTLSHMWVCCSGSTVKTMHANWTLLAGICEKQGLLPKLLSQPVPKLWLNRVCTLMAMQLQSCLYCTSVYQGCEPKWCFEVFTAKS